MRTSSFEAEVARCRQLATEYEGRSEAKLLLSLAEAFQVLREPTQKAPVEPERIRLFT
jgi:hypothetical protein